MLLDEFIENSVSGIYAALKDLKLKGFNASIGPIEITTYVFIKDGAFHISQGNSLRNFKVTVHVNQEGFRILIENYKE